MPIYDYSCHTCGPFTALRPMAECEAPHVCEGCGAAAPRALVNAPRLGLLSGERRRAHAVNERSASAPATSADYGSRHGAGCSCCSAKASRMTYRGPDGSKSFPSGRPWMISH